MSHFTLNPCVLQRGQRWRVQRTCFNRGQSTNRPGAVWFRKQTGWWVTINGVLHKSEKDEAAVRKAFYKLMMQDSPARQERVAALLVARIESRMKYQKALR